MLTIPTQQSSENPDTSISVRAQSELPDVPRAETCDPYFIPEKKNSEQRGSETMIINLVDRNVKTATIHLFEDFNKNMRRETKNIKGTKWNPGENT